MIPLTVNLRGVTQVFGGSGDGTTAIRGMDLTVARGEFLSIIGPSGCGKSTLLKIIAGIILPTCGEVLVNGASVNGPVREAELMLQRPVLLPWKTVRVNIMTPLRVRFGAHSRDELLANQLLELVGLSDWAERYPQELSLGMQQRVSLCRALITNPTLLLMDEPFSSLDEITRERMALELLRIWDGHYSTVIFVTHSVAEAVLLSDRVVVMTGTPGSTRASFLIRIPRPRRVDMLASAEFGELAGRIRDAIAMDGPCS
ncbi:NitT/TauT family transport system ATP-binding protein [Geodermatophilus bullaregiensis]|uniref:ABC transporter ATP-binding protein n=1 Tax=Geodermatophilus bullaregiensis TaxID=1564160 RepID=UPI001957E7A9|nr:ABC transporter ATP-binding protein [Geodermatophilus bullaregiensis]MBM7808027.1 NitT/TauT family transport system ATP-binding protein [Geodermatophilus bullaregiensis]